MIEIVPTNTCPASLAELSLRSEIFSRFASQIHLDIDDGAFAPEISWPYFPSQWAELEEMAISESPLPYSDTLSYEAHLMVEDPLRVGELLARVGCRRIIAHIEAFESASSAMEAFVAWKAAGAREVGLSALIETPLSVLDPLVIECDVVQIMSIATLGKQGAPFDARAISRIAQLHEKYGDLLIAVDGGVAESNIAELARAGAKRFCVGSAISKAEDPKSAYERLQLLAEGA